jgi:hypothetical protein
MGENMKTTELINKLQKIIEEYGDLEVVTDLDYTFDEPDPYVRKGEDRPEEDPAIIAVGQKYVIL